MPSNWLPIDDPASAQYDAQVMAVLKDIKSLSSRVPAWPLDTGTSAYTENLRDDRYIITIFKKSLLLG